MWQLNLEGSKSRFGFTRNSYEEVFNLADELIAFKTDNKESLESCLEEIKTVLNRSFPCRNENGDLKPLVEDLSEIPLKIINLVLRQYDLSIARIDY